MSHEEGAPPELVEAHRIKTSQYQSGRRKTTLFAFGAALLIVLLVVALWNFLPTNEARTVSGEVRCASGQPVTGVWVGEAGGGGDHASWRAEPSDPSRAKYRMKVKADEYEVHVGCGGTKEKWGEEPWSETVGGTRNDFLCYDKPGSEHYDTCARTGP
jgi:hypothetical protein